MIKEIKSDVEYTFSYNQPSNTLIFVWKPKIFSQDRFKEIVTLFSDYAVNLKIKYIFVDARENKVIIMPETQTWHDTIIVPKYAKAGVKKIGFLIPANIFSELSHVKTFSHQNAISKIETKFYKSEEELKNWLNLNS
ncbi:MAG: hypothetical protein EAZ27_00920 [Cytophagales bacterium]|nr:MAG: hypothetical protein EAZ27_00920 [Cytophagales bacterium]